MLAPFSKLSHQPAKGRDEAGGFTLLELLVVIAIIVILAALTFFPVPCLRPIVEHGLILAGGVF